MGAKWSLPYKETRARACARARVCIRKANPLVYRSLSRLQAKNRSALSIFLLTPFEFRGIMKIGPSRVGACADGQPFRLPHWQTPSSEKKDGWLILALTPTGFCGIMKGYALRPLRLLESRLRVRAIRLPTSKRREHVRLGGGGASQGPYALARCWPI